MDENNSSQIYKDAKKNSKMNLLICLIIIIGVSVYYGFSGNSSVKLDIGEEMMTVSDSSDGIDFSITVNYDEITDIYLMDSAGLGLGEMITGYDGKKLQFGEWSSSSFGDVSVYAVPSVEKYMVITTDDTVFAMNLESEETTESLYNAMCEMLTDAGYTYAAHPGVSG